MKQTRVKARFGMDEVGFEEPVAPGPKDGQRLYLQHYSAVAEMNVGSPQLTAYRGRLVADLDIQEHAEEILEVNMQGPRWMDTFFRNVCQEAIKQRKAREERENATAYADNTRFGMF